MLNFIYADDAPEKRDITKEFFENFIRTKKYDTWISDYVLEEIDATTDIEKKEKLLNLLIEYPIANLVTIEHEIDTIDALADQYIFHGIIPAKKKLDALHIATCIIMRIDYLVSWNIRHLANVNKERRVLALNLELGYLHPIRIITPTDLMNYET